MQFRRVLGVYWRVVMLKKWQWLSLFLLYGVGTLLFALLEPLFLKWIIDFVNGAVPGAEGVWEELVWIFTLMVVNMVVYNMMFRFGDFFIVSLETEGMRELSNQAFEHLQKHSYQFFSNEFVGSLVAKARRFAQSFETVMDQTVFKFWLDGLKVLGVFGVLVYLDLTIGFAFITWAILYFSVTYALLKWKIPTDIAEAKADSKVTARLADTLTNILNVKTFATGRRERKSFGEFTEFQHQQRLKSWRRLNVQWWVNGTMMVILSIGGLYYSLLMWNKGVFTAGTVVLLQSYFAVINFRLWELGRSMMLFTKAISDADEMIRIIDREEDVKDLVKTEKCRIDKGEIEFVNVSFGYEVKNFVFDRFNLKIKAGEKIGLVGHSGSGKSTLTKLLLRFVDVTGGEILIDGQDVRKLKKDDLRRKISYVPQDPVLFHRSLRENIAYADLGVSGERLAEVVEKAQAAEFVERLEKGLDTFVGERGVKLSGGERQRVAIARAMLEDGPIVILDEATSALDSVSEVLIQKALEELLKKKTAIVVAHRLSTVKQMDRILVMERGRIVEEGSHEELLAKGGSYAELWEHQSGGFLGD